MRWEPILTDPNSLQEKMVLEQAEKTALERAEKAAQEQAEETALVRGSTTRENIEEAGMAALEEAGTEEDSMEGGIDFCYAYGGPPQAENPAKQDFFQ